MMRDRAQRTAAMLDLAKSIGSLKPGAWVEVSAEQMAALKRQRWITYPIEIKLAEIGNDERMLTFWAMYQHHVWWLVCRPWAAPMGYCRCRGPFSSFEAAIDVSQEWINRIAERM